MTGYKPVFIDTNIFLYAADSLSPFHQKAKNLLERSSKMEFESVITPQIILELYSVITNKKRIENAYTPSEANTFIENIMTFIKVKYIYFDPEAMVILKKILKANKIKDRQVFDAAIVATMSSNGVQTIYTANDKDFKKLSDQIEVLNPL